MDELARPDVEAFRQQKKLPIAVVLEDIRSGLNVGSVFRTADAFALAEVVLCGYTCQPPHREILKSALGSTESVAWRHENSSVEAVLKLKNEGWRVFAVEQAEPKIWLHDFQVENFGEKIALVFGNEVEGVSQNLLEICDGCIEIQQFGTKHSLNISVAAGIVLWQVASQFVSVLSFRKNPAETNVCRIPPE